MTQSEDWFFLIFGVLGGLAVFLYGMFVMNENIQLSAGKKFNNILLKLTGSSFRGFLTGVGITSVIQSSSATTVMEVGLVGAGLMTFFQSLAVTKGAELGTTVTAQLLAFRLTDYALLITAVGFFISLIVKTKQAKSIALTIFGFGLLFLGMKIMSDALRPLRDFQPFLDTMAAVEAPILGILVGLFFTLVVQSSSATSGIVVAMAFSGTMNLAQAIPINLGASIGTTITAILASMPLNRDAKRAAFAHTFFQTASVIMVFFLMCIPFGGENFWYHFVRWFTETFFGTTDVARQIAMAHTLMSVLSALVFLPILPWVSKIMCKVYPSKDEERPFGPLYLDEKFTNKPAFAINLARKEVIRQGEIVSKMLEDSISCFDLSDRTSSMCENISLTDIKVDTLRNAIVQYLMKVAQNQMPEIESKQEIALLYITNDIEGIGDIIDKNIVPMGRKIITQSLAFSKEGWDELCEMHQRLVVNFQTTLKELETFDKSLAKRMTVEKSSYGKYEDEMRMKHIGRLHSGLKETLETSSIHLDLIDQYKRINEHLANIAHTILSCNLALEFKVSKVPRSKSSKFQSSRVQRT